MYDAHQASSGDDANDQMITAQAILLQYRAAG